MMRMREHIYRLYGSYLIFGIEQLKVAGLSSRITADVDDTLGLSKQNHIDYIIVHTCTWRIGNNHIRTSVLVDEILRQDILHITGIEQRIVDTVYLRIDLCIFYSLGDIFYTDDLTCLTRNEVGNSTRTGIKVVYQLVASQSCKVPGYLIQIVCLFRIGLIERFRTYLKRSPSISSKI